MADYQEKRELAINRVIQSIAQLDETLLDIHVLENVNNKKYTIKKWYEEMKALHNIKHSLYDIGKYDKYNTRELLKFERDFYDLIK